MDKEAKKNKILGFIRKQRIAVISTVSPEGSPQGAVIEFGETDELEIIFSTFDRSRKYKNIVNNPRVAFTIGWDEGVTVQYEGTCSELVDDELEQGKANYFTKNPNAQKWENVEGMRFFKVTPTWIRYSDLNVDPWEVFEVLLS